MAVEARHVPERQRRTRHLPNLRNQRVRPPLSAAQLRRFRAVLHEQREFRVTQLAELSAMPLSAEGPDDPVREITERVRRAARFALSEIDAALDRMAAGRFGLCAGCDGPIAVERLEVLPMAALCMPCQREADVRRGVH